MASASPSPHLAAWLTVFCPPLLHHVISGFQLVTHSFCQGPHFLQLLSWSAKAQMLHYIGDTQSAPTEARQVTTVSEEGKGWANTRSQESEDPWLHPLPIVAVCRLPTNIFVDVATSTERSILSMIMLNFMFLNVGSEFEKVKTYMSHMTCIWKWVYSFQTSWTLSFWNLLIDSVFLEKRQLDFPPSTGHPKMVSVLMPSSQLGFS